MILRMLGAILLAATGSACSTNAEMLGQMYVSPGKYELYRCPEIVGTITANLVRERELTGLMDRASEASSGAVINAMVYSPQLATTREELRQLHEVSAQKNCSSQHVPPASEPAKPADAPARRERRAQ